MSDSIVHAGFLLHSQSSDPYKARARAAEVKRWAKYLPAQLVYGLMPYQSGKPDIGYAQVTSAHGQTVRLHFAGIGMSGEQLKRFEQRAVRTCANCINDMAEMHQIELVGLGAHTASIGNGGRDIHDLVNIPVTTGNSLTTYYGIQSVLRAAEAMHIWTKNSTLCLVGASGNIGRAVGQLIRSEFERVILVPSKTDLATIATELRAEVIEDLNIAISQSDVVVTATTSAMLNYDIDCFKPGSVIVVLSRPRDIAGEIMSKRDDVLAIEGGNVTVPNLNEYIITRDIEQHVHGTIFPCMAETITLALDGNVRDVSMGPLEARRILKIGQRAEYHGFRLAPDFRFEREITLGEINDRYEAGQVALHEPRFGGII